MHFCTYRPENDSKKGKKDKKGKDKKKLEIDDITGIVREAVANELDERLTWDTTTPTQMPPTSKLRSGFKYAQPPQYRYAEISQTQWESLNETSKVTTVLAADNGRKIDNFKGAVYKEVKAAMKDTETAIQSVIDKTEYNAKGVENAIKDTHKAVNGNHAEYTKQQTACMAEVEKMRKYLDDEARKREEEAMKSREEQLKNEARQQAFDVLREFTRADREAGRSSRSGSNSRATPSSSSSRSSRRRRATQTETHEHERREQRHEKQLQDLFADFFRCAEATNAANRLENQVLAERIRQEFEKMRFNERNNRVPPYQWPEEPSHGHWQERPFATSGRYNANFDDGRDYWNGHCHSGGNTHDNNHTGRDDHRYYSTRPGWT